jgi:hypothetical protein
VTDFQRAVASGGLAALEAVRDALTADLEVCQSFRDRAALYNKLLDVLPQIEKLKPPAEADEIDQIRNRRNRRVLGAARVPLMRD